MKQRILSIFLVLFLIFSSGVTAMAATVYTINSRIPVYNDSYSASQRTGSVKTYEPGNYFIYKTVNGMHNVSRTEGAPGGWINPIENRTVIGNWQTNADVNFRTGPSTSYPIITKLLKGTPVEVVSKTSTAWYEVRYNGTTGFVSASYLTELTPAAPAEPTAPTTPTAPAEPAAPAASPVYYKTTTNLNFRTGPSTAYPIITMLPAGTQVELVNKNTSGWYEVLYNGKKGFVSSSYLTLAVQAEPAPTVPAAPTAPSGPVYYQTINNVNFRTGPSVTTALIQYLLAGTKVELVSKYSATWYEVRYGGKVGYISASYLKEYVEAPPKADGEDPAEPTQEIIKLPYVATIAVNFRTGPSTDYPIIRMLDIGTTLSYLSPVRDEWVQVMQSGTVGYISSKYITPIQLQMPSLEPVTVTEGTKTHVVNARADVRTGPGTGYAKVSILYPGSFIGVSSINNSWAEVSYYENEILKTGYVNTSFISPQATTQGGTPKIGISFNPNNLKFYIEAIKRAGGEPVLLPQATSLEQAKELTASVSGMVFAGGRATTASDRFMMDAALSQDKPTLGICLGFQLINYATGGTLTDLVGTDFTRSQIHRDPDVESYRYHNIIIKPDSKLAGLVGTGTDNVNSFHRYIVATLGTNLKVMATSPDGVVEGIERTDKTFVVGIASHPERMYSDGNTIYHSLFIELIRQARAQQQ